MEASRTCGNEGVESNEIVVAVPVGIEVPVAATLAQVVQARPLVTVAIPDSEKAREENAQQGPNRIIDVLTQRNHTHQVSRSAPAPQHRSLGEYGTAPVERDMYVDAHHGGQYLVREDKEMSHISTVEGRRAGHDEFQEVATATRRHEGKSVEWGDADLADRHYRLEKEAAERERARLDEQERKAAEEEKVPMGMTYQVGEYKSIYDDPDYLAESGASEYTPGSYSIPDYKSVYDKEDES